MVKNMTFQETPESLSGIALAVAQVRPSVYFGLLLMDFVIFLTGHLVR
jgi:hypothetical protein